VITTIDPNIYLALAAMLGGLFYHVAGYMDAKSNDPDLKYQYSYFVQTGITILLIAGLYQAAEYELSFFTVITSFITGLGGNASASMLIKRKK
jgi:hypothetical protein